MDDHDACSLAKQALFLLLCGSTTPFGGHCPGSGARNACVVVVIVPPSPRLNGYRIIHAFRDYQHSAEWEVARWQANLRLLPPHHKDILLEKARAKLAAARAAIHTNHLFIKAMLQVSQHATPCFLRVACMLRVRGGRGVDATTANSPFPSNATAPQTLCSCPRNAPTRTSTAPGVDTLSGSGLILV